TRYWTYSRVHPDSVWTKPDRPISLRFGEAVSLTFVSDTPKTLIWRTPNNIPPELDNDKYVYDYRGIPLQPDHFFDYIEQDDYIPFFVWLPDELVSYDDDSELALYIDDVLYGSTVIYGQLVQIRAYVVGIDLENAVIEFRYYQHGQRSGEQLFSEYQVFEQATSSYQSNRIDFSENKKFYQVLLLNESQEETDLPKVTSLDGNFPNPFNPSTTIAYSLAESGNVKLQIFNIRGQLVKTLVNEVQNAGRYTVDWHGDNDRQRSVGSGVYFYQLETSAGRQVKRMVLLK
ncbi:MAG: T9SS type A sorting domain-containing protein, partial [Candidatus Cloacimonetes bacterium]|nr:T9SS type A sorting domain-containing protein [Candidatus Cloacimonadota bacterium]